MGNTTKLRALVVDDLQVNRIILGKLLQSFGFDVSYSENGQEAVQRFLRCPDISCILMDINMPGMDGLQASRQIRSIEAALGHSRMTSKGSEESLTSSYQEEQVVPDASTPSSTSTLSRRVPIVGVSACSLTEQLKSAALDGLPISEDTDRPWELCGMDLFVEKPINRSKLECILGQLQDQLGVPSTDCSSSDALETSLGEGQLASALCCAPDLETDSAVSSCDAGKQLAKRGLEDTALCAASISTPHKKRKLEAALSSC